MWLKIPKKIYVNKSNIDVGAGRGEHMGKEPIKTVFISCIVVTYQAADVLEQALLSLIGQTYKPEIIVVDGGSEDGTKELLERYKKDIDTIISEPDNGIYDAMIGLCLLRCGSSNEAEVYVSNSFYNGMSGIINFMYIYTLLNIRNGKFDLAEDMLSWGKSFMQGLVVSDEISYFDRVTATVMMLGGYVKLRQGDLSLAKQELKAAAETARRFDSAPCYRVRGLRFLTQPTESYDILGKTAAEGLEYILKEINDPAFDKLWKEVAEK